MDEDIFTDLSVLNAKKTYIKKTKKVGPPRSLSQNKKNIDCVEKPRPLTTKVAVKFLLEGKLKSKVCRYCLNVTPVLSELDQIMKIGGTGTIYKVSIRDIVASFHPFKVVEDPNFPNKICQKCLDKALSAYLFTQQCERAERAMLNCFEDMYEKFEKLDPIDRPKKRGRQKLNPNYNILRAEHNKVIDYAEPIINIVNIGAETVTKEPELNDLECKKCWQVLPNLESLLNHETIHPKTMWYHCRLCGKSFPKRNQLKKHNNRVHVLGKELVPQSEKDFKCKECGHVTDSFIQHLQHVEKHKFKNIMEHLIKKKVDKLCAVCFNKGTKMMDLDKMVCIHGCHPDLMGDKSLYTLLASTLPDPKSYKYQELYIPSKAQIMTISKRQNTYDDQHMKKITPLTYNRHFREDFVLSYPIFISKCTFKTDHFYYFVFSDPDYEKDVNIICETIDINVTETKYKFTPKTKVGEVTDISDVTDDLSTKKSKSGRKKAVKNVVDTGKDIDNKVRYDYIDGNANSDLSNAEIDERKVEKSEVNQVKYEFSNPELVTDVNEELNVKHIKGAAADISQVTLHQFLTPDYGNIESRQELKFHLKDQAAIHTNDNDEQTDVFDTQWVFKKYSNTYLISQDLQESKCKFCWIFKHVGICSYCKQPIKDNKNNSNATKGESIEKVQNEDKDSVIQINRDKDIWQCGICLTKNKQDLSTCHCCGTTRVTEYDNMKIAFGNNKTFFPLNDIEDNEVCQKETKEVNRNEVGPNEIDINHSTDRISFIEELTMMDCRSNSEVLIEPVTFASSVKDMEVETNTTFKITNAKCDSEAMDVEDNPTNYNTVDWNTTVLKFNIDTAAIPMNTIAATTEPVLKFNIGYATGQKPHLKKMKRVIRHLHKPFQK